MIKLSLFTLYLFMVLGCSQAPELSSTKETSAQSKIKANIEESDRAKKEYNSLQQQRLNN